MANTVEYGIRINVEGNRPAAEAIGQVRQATTGLSEAVQEASRDTAAGMQSIAQSTATAATASVNHLRSFTDELGDVTRQQHVARTATEATTAAQRSSRTATEEAAAATRSSRPAFDGFTRDTTRAGISAAQMSASMRQVPAQITDIVTSLQGGQSPMTVFLQQGGQLRDMFGSFGGAARALGTTLLGIVNLMTIAAAAAGVLALAYYQGSKEADAYTHSIVMSGNAAGVTSGQLASMAASVSKSVGTQGAAAEALAALLATGEVSFDNLQRFAQVSVQASRTVGRSVDDMAADFAELGRSPLQASLKLNEQYHYLTAAVYAQIKALSDQGRAEEAAEAAQKAYANAFDTRTKTLEDNLGSIEKAWRSATDTAKLAWDAFLGVGRKESNEQKLTNVRRQIQEAQSNTDYGTGVGSDAREYARAKARERLPELKQQEAQLAEIVKKEREAAVEQARSAALTEATTRWDKVSDQFLDRRVQQEREITKAREAAAAVNKNLPKGDPDHLGISDGQLDGIIAKIKAKYADLNNVSLAQLENTRNLTREVTAGQAADLESLHKRQLVSDAAYYNQKRDLDVQNIDSAIAVAKKQAEIAGGKDDLTARAQFLGQVKVLEQQRVNAIQAAANAIAETAAASAKVVIDQARTWSNATLMERQALADQVAMFGKSAQARQILIEQLKIDAEVRQLIAKRQAEGHPLTEQEIADLQKAAKARKDNIAATLGQQQALAGAEQLREENRKFLTDSIVDEEQRNARLLQIDADLWRERIQLAGDGTEAQRKLQEQFDIWYANRQLAPVVDKWKSVIGNLDANFRDGFRDMLEHGHDAFKSFASAIGSTLKASLADALYQTFIKKYVVQVVTSLAGTFSGSDVAALLNGQSGGTPQATGSVGAAQSALSLFNALKAGGGFEQSIANGAQGLFDQLGLSMSGGAPGTAAQWIGKGGSTFAGYTIGSTLNSAISGQYQTGSGFQTVEKIGTAIASYFGGPIGGAIAGAISGLVNRAFGMGDKQITQTGIRGMISASGVTGENYSDWHQDGGWFRSDKNGTDTSALSSEMAKQFTAGVQAIKTASAGFAQSLGLNADSIQNYSRQFNLVFTKDTAANQKVIEDFIASVGDEMARKLVPTIDSLTKSGETASAALQRLSSEFQATDQVAKLMGKDVVAMFGSAGVSSAAARERLIELAGGIDALAQQAAFYSQNFLSEAERMAPVIKAVQEAMADLGLQSITTKQQFKDEIDYLISSGAVLTQSGAELYAKLMALAPAFAQVADYAATANTGSGASAVDARRQALNRAYQKEADSLKQVIDRMGSFNTSLRNFRDGLALGELSPLTPEQKYAEARRQFDQTLAAAQSGDVNAQNRLTDIATAFLNASAVVNASDSHYQADFTMVRNATEDMAEWAEQQVDVAQASLDALNRQVDGLVDIKDEVSTVAAAIADLVAVLDPSGKAQVDANQASAITSLYQSLLGRAPDADGFQYWLNAAKSGASIEAIAQSFYDSPEYQSKHGVVPAYGAAAEPGNLEDIAALLAAIKQMGADINGLRHDQEEQSSEAIGAGDRQADRIASATVQAVSSVAWLAKSKPELV